MSLTFQPVLAFHTKSLLLMIDLVIAILSIVVAVLTLYSKLK